MDDMDTVGRYGTVSLVRKLTFESVTSYPVDDERTTFGRDPKCSIRMYFHFVDPLHCTLYFDDGKAYLQVTGASGVVVDETLIPAGGTVRLNNSSRFKIWQKLFQFTYPPREIRSQLLAVSSTLINTVLRAPRLNVFFFLQTPRHVSTRSLRMSMIRSAVILTPNIVSSQALDLRALQSPVRPYREAPHEQVTFVESNQVAVVEDGVQYSDASVHQNPFARRMADEEERALVALEEVEDEHEEEMDERFSRTTPTRTTPRTNYGNASPTPRLFAARAQPSQPFTIQHRQTYPQIAPPPSLPQLPILRTTSAIFAPSPTRRGPLQPLSTVPPTPGRSQLPPSQPFNRSTLTLGREPVTSNNAQLNFAPPRTPPKRRGGQGRPSLHKAVLLRSAHKAYVQQMKTKKEEAEEEMEVEDVVSPERQGYVAGNDVCDEDAEGEDEDEGYEEEVSSTGAASGVVQGTLNLLGNLVPSFMRKSVSPDRMDQRKLDLSAEHQEDADNEDDVEDESAQTATTQGSRVERPVSPVASTIAKGDEDILPQSSGKTQFQSQQQQNETGHQNGKGKGVDPKERSNLATFLTPQAARAPAITTNTMVRPYANVKATPTGVRPGFNLNFFGKPTRSVKALDLSLDVPVAPIEENEQENMAEQQQQETFKDTTVKVKEETEMDTEEARKQKELRTQQRQSLLAALDAEPKRHVGGSRAARRSSIFRKSFGASIGPSPTPEPLVDTKNPFLVGSTGSSAAVESDLTDDEEEEEKKGAFEQLKANMERAKRESLYRSTRLSLGGAMTSPGKKVDAIKAEAGHSPVFKLLRETQSSSTQGSRHSDASSAATTESDDSTEDEAAEGGNARVGGDMELDITEADPEEHLPSQPVSPLVQHFAEDDVKREAEPVSAEEAQEDAKSPVHQTRGRSARTPATKSPRSAAKRCAKRKAPIEDEEASEDEDIEPTPVTNVRRGRSRSKTPAAILESPPALVRMTRAQRAASAAPSQPSPAKKRASVSPSKKSVSSTSSRRTRSRSVAREPEEEEVVEVASPAPAPVVVAPKTAPTKRPASRIGQLRAPPQTGPAKASTRTAKTAEAQDDVEEPSNGTKVIRRTASKLALPKSVAAAKPVRQTTKPQPSVEIAPLPKPAAARRRIGKTPSAPVIDAPVAGPSRGRAVAPAPTATTSRLKRAREADDDADTPTTTTKGKQASVSALRVQRSTRANNTEVDDERAAIEDSSPRKRRKVVEESVAPTKAGPRTRKVSASRVPTTTNRRIASTSTTVTAANGATTVRRTPVARNVSDDHDKENAPDSAPAQLEATKPRVVSRSGGKVVPTSAPAAGPSNTKTSASQEKNATVVSRSLRTRAKK
ncbi:hypothetical protein FRB93_006774 [Tulasnella sp. JGI-2019a]|nr:hypothetical protein FRB93_006774 [Tulasnella sp. JGI-2019a]